MEERLKLVTTEVASGCHVDVGTDHGLLPLYLLNHRICEKIIVTEISSSAYRVARQALWGRADVRLGDGLQPLGVGEADSASLCGMGGTLMSKILSASPRRVPDIVVCQANKDSHKVRRWARESGFHLIREQMVPGRWIYKILTFHRLPGEDPAYGDVEEELALYFGPHLLKNRHPVLREELERRRKFHSEHPQNQDLRRVKAALEYFVP